MLITLHKNATTTPAVRAAIQQSSASEYELARQYGVSRQTIRRWRKRDSVHDASHTPHRLQTTLNAAQEELAARLRAVCRRQAGAGTALLRAGEAEVDLSARAARRAGLPVGLTSREWAVLEALALRAGRIVPKHDLETLVHGEPGAVASNALEVHVSSLRRKLGKEVIETVRGLGYRFGALR